VSLCRSPFYLRAPTTQPPRMDLKPSGKTSRKAPRRGKPRAWKATKPLPRVMTAERTNEGDSGAEVSGRWGELRGLTGTDRVGRIAARMETTFGPSPQSGGGAGASGPKTKFALTMAAMSAMFLPAGLEVRAAGEPVSSGQPASGNTVQVNVRSILDGRSVTTLSKDDAVVTWNARVGMGATGGCGYMTNAASKAINLGAKPATGLPDDGVFEPTEKLPRTVLNFSNADSTSNQTKTVFGKGSFEFNVPPTKYSRMFLFLSAAPNLVTDITVTASYKDGTPVARDYGVPEFSMRAHRPPDTDPDWCVLVGNVGKWDAQNVCREGGKHFIDALNIHPDPSKTLDKIKVESKPTKDGFLTFWGATGVTAEPDAAAARPATATRVLAEITPAGPLPEGATGIAHRFPGDTKITNAPSVIFADDFENYSRPADLEKCWDNVYQKQYVGLSTAPANVFRGGPFCELELGKIILADHDNGGKSAAICFCPGRPRVGSGLRKKTQ
jgi:hypothetical protein